jgi:hypothetical protein
MPADDLFFTDTKTVLYSTDPADPLKQRAASTKFGLTPFAPHSLLVQDDTDPERCYGIFESARR